MIFRISLLLAMFTIVSSAFYTLTAGETVIGESVCGTMNRVPSVCTSSVFNLGSCKINLYSGKELVAIAFPGSHGLMLNSNPTVTTVVCEEGSPGLCKWVLFGCN